MRMDSIMFVLKPKMWYSGSAQTVTICSPAGIFFSAGWYQASACSRLATRLRCSSTAPLLTPVVPPVYCSTAMSSGPDLGFGQRLAAAFLGEWRR